MIVVHSTEASALYPRVVISSLMKWLENLHSAICTLPLVYDQEITTRLFHCFLQLVYAHWGFTTRGIIPFTSIDPLLCHVVLRSKSPCSPHISLPAIPAYNSAFLAPPFGTYITDLYHLLGQDAPILCSWWHIFILGYRSKNQSLIWFRWHINHRTTGNPQT
jgi:hypothetical protein